MNAYAASQWVLQAWVHQINQRRKLQGNSVAELRLDPDHHYQYFRMSAEQMDDLLSRTGAELKKQLTNLRDTIETKQPLAIALR